MRDLAPSGAVAQLGERLNGIQEVRSSILLGSTINRGNKGLSSVYAETELCQYFQSSVQDLRTLGQVIEKYVKFRLAQGKNLSSYQYLRTIWREILGEVPVRQVTAEIVEEILDLAMEARGLSPASRNNMLAELSGLFSWTLTKRWVDSHPLKGRIPRLKVDNARERWLTPQEIEGVKAHCEPWLCNLIDFSVRTGMRLGESTGLTVTDYVQDSRGNGYVVVQKTKNGSRLTYPLVGATKEMVLTAVRRAHNGAEYVFPGPLGGNARTSIRRHFKKAVLAAGLDYGRGKYQISWHTLRHSMASLAINNGVPIEVVQRMGNWRSRVMVERYAHLSQETMRKGAERLESVFR